jgi:hypothetical protein
MDTLSHMHATCLLLLNYRDVMPVVKLHAEVYRTIMAPPRNVHAAISWHEATLVLCFEYRVPLWLRLKALKPEAEVILRLTVGQSVDQYVLVSGTPLGPMTRFTFSFLYRKIALLFVLGCPLWREDGSVICSAIYQWSESRRTHNYF